MRLRTFCSMMLFCNFLIYAQEPYTQNEFSSPMGIPLVLSGTFGELRSNHFHAGIDIKTQGRQGLPIYAIADGTVSRFKVSLWGYGKALYVAHQNGYTSVYAHLQKFGPKIEEYVKRLQYAKKSYEVEDFPDFGELKVKKGDIIAYSGNTGGSSGPHLHFEIRKSASQKPTNPLLHGVEVKDGINPNIVGLYAYPLEAGSHVEQKQEKIQLNFARQKDGSFLAPTLDALGTIGFGVNAFDRQDLAANKNGVYSITQKVNGSVISRVVFDEFSFGETRYINTLIDYGHFIKRKQRIQKLFKDEGNKLGLYKDLILDGKVIVLNDYDYEVQIEIADKEGNDILIKVPVKGKELTTTAEREIETGEYKVGPAKPASFDLDGAKVYFPEATFYTDAYLDLEKGKDTIKIHDGSIPIHRRFNIRFDVSRFAKEERKKMFIARLDRKSKKPIFQNTYRLDNSFTARTKVLGTYFLLKDTVAPTIKPRNFRGKKNLSNFHYLSVDINDDVSGIDSYSATLNGQWILMEYEPKKNRLTYSFEDGYVACDECILKITVKDNVGNTNELEHSFTR